MRLNNKGITLVEIIVSVALISIVLIFLFSLLIQVNNENSDNEVKSSYLVNQSTFIKQIEEDFLDYKLLYGENCDDYGISVYNTSGDTNDYELYLPRWNEDYDHFKCLKFELDDSNYSYAFLFLYKRNDNKTILSYYRGDFKQSVELEEFDWAMNVDDDGDQLSVSATNNVNNMYAFSLPIVGPDSNDYSINLSYYKP